MVQFEDFDLLIELLIFHITIIKITVLLEQKVAGLVARKAEKAENFCYKSKL